MKKSKMNPEDVLKDLNEVSNLMNQVQNLDLEKLDMNKFKDDIEKVGINLKEKYKDILKENEEDLDSEE
tara:strand:- start:36 stop:242 length:207 start_codon:yes stop_codon:yes gene_type:complete